MGFAKWFGGRTSKTVATPAVPPSVSVSVSASKPSIAGPGVRSVAGAAFPAKRERARGFDPYNSGAFKNRGAWERVWRR